ncbi:D-glycerate dehydrogenase [Desulfosporosinus sp. FKB]|uniref:2-hydroxyacid dehydrogenase n=1 Tax=Desulfosporosinus sp. FKB TaxID=1969835 RepID=UPI000B496E85|nr:D-glycerate dehydrogenase [Desulfosporosinus sp. FKB]
MPPKVFIAKPVPQAVRDYVGKSCDYEMWNEQRPISRSELLDRISDIEGLMVTSLISRIDEELLAKAPKLRIISNISVGYDNFDLEVMKKRQVLGTNTPGVLSNTVADLALGLMLCSARRLSELDRFVKEGQWNSQISEAEFGYDVHHQTLGIIGMGSIGLEVARRAKNGFKMNILYFNRNRNNSAEEELDARYCDLPELLAQSDFVIVLAPLTKETKHLIGSNEFSLMKTSAIFFNISRGGTVDEEALISALRERKIAGAALDVFSHEPINKDNPLLQFPNVITVPHIGSATMTCRNEMAMLAAKNLVAGLKGENPPNLVKELL